MSAGSRRPASLRLDAALAVARGGGEAGDPDALGFGWFRGSEATGRDQQSAGQGRDRVFHGPSPDAAVRPRNVGCEPPEDAFVEVLVVRRRREHVELAGVDHQLGGHAEALEGLVELLGVDDGHVPVLLAADDEGRGDHLVDLEVGRHLVVQLRVLPRQPELVLPPQLVVVVAVVGDVEGRAGAGVGGLEAVGLGDHVVGEHAAVGPAADRQSVGVGIAAGDGVVDRGHHVVEVLVAPGLPDRGREVLAVAGRAARVGHDHDVAGAGEELALEVEAEVVLHHRPAVDAQHRRDIGRPARSPAV